MSRSYKHTGWIQDQSSKFYGKRFANKRVRRLIDIPSGSSYKKFYDSWNIADYILSCRGKLIQHDHRIGRKHRKIVPGGIRNSWWWIDYDDIDRIWRDWRK